MLEATIHFLQDFAIIEASFMYVKLCEMKEKLTALNGLFFLHPNDDHNDGSASTFLFSKWSSTLE